MTVFDPTVSRLRQKVPHGLLDGWNAAVFGLRQKDPFTLYFDPTERFP